MAGGHKSPPERCAPKSPQLKIIFKDVLGVGFGCAKASGVHADVQRFAAAKDAVEGEAAEKLVVGEPFELRRAAGHGSLQHRSL